MNLFMIKEILIIKTGLCLFILLLFVGLSLLSSGRVSSAEFCVDKKNTTGTVDGTSFYPYKTIQAAINAASSIEDNTIRVAAGSYTENISIDAKVIDILGGYAGGTSGDYGGGTGGIFDIQSPDTNVTVIQGNTIQGNTAVGDHGGGLYISGKLINISQNLVLENEVGRDLGYGWGAGGWIADVLNSPCIDMGNSLNDYIKEKMPNGGRINMGAYGNTSEASKGNGSKSILLPYILLLY